MLVYLRSQILLEKLDLLYRPVCHLNCIILANAANALLQTNTPENTEPEQAEKLICTGH